MIYKVAEDPVFSFDNKLAFSNGVSENTHPDTIKKLILGCVKVEKSSIAMDLTGIDFTATLRSGNILNIDVKSREQGCSRFWKNKEPELALEIWSVVGEKPGWTIDDSKCTDYTLHVFHPSDSKEVFLLPFHLLRIAFLKNFSDWRDKFFCATQSSQRNGRRWDSRCYFVPAGVVIKAISFEMRQLQSAAS